MSGPKLLQCRNEAQVTEDERCLFGVSDPFDAQNLWVEVDLEDGWRAALRLVPGGVDLGPPVAAEVRIFPADDWPDRKPGEWRASILGVHAPEANNPERLLNSWQRDGREDVRFPEIGQGVPSSVLRQVPLRVVQQRVDEILRRIQELPGIEQWDARAAAGLVGTGIVAGGSPAKRRADAWSDHRYATLAAAYVESVQAGERAPVTRVAAGWGMKATQVRDAIHTARRRGILTPPPKRGLAGGQLTAFGRRLLHEQEARDDG